MHASSEFPRADVSRPARIRVAARPVQGSLCIIAAWPRCPRHGSSPSSTARRPSTSHRLWAAATGHSPLWGLVVATLLETGIKRDELLALSPLDVLFHPGAHGGGVVRLRRRRDAQRTRLRNVAITERLRPPLREWLRSL